MIVNGRASPSPATHAVMCSPRNPAAVPTPRRDHLADRAYRVGDHPDHFVIDRADIVVAAQTGRLGRPRRGGAPVYGPGCNARRSCDTPAQVALPPPRHTRSTSLVSFTLTSRKAMPACLRDVICHDDRANNMT